MKHLLVGALALIATLGIGCSGAPRINPEGVEPVKMEAFEVYDQVACREFAKFIVSSKSDVCTGLASMLYFGAEISGWYDASMESSMLSYKPLAIAEEQDMIKVDMLLTEESMQSIVASYFGPDVRFAWSQLNVSDDPTKGRYQLYALRGYNGGTQPFIDGSYLVEAEAVVGMAPCPMVSMKFNAEGAERIYEVTKRNVGRPLAVLLDGRVYSLPVIMSDIVGGLFSISGDLTEEEAERLVVAITKFVY